jgi:glycosyltransferase involved in cell wall biosynthesis
MHSIAARGYPRADVRPYRGSPFSAKAAPVSPNAIPVENLPQDIARVDTPVVLSVVRNERSRLANWLKHYRDMGISRFLIVDNGSTDGTAEFLASQTDVALVEHVASYGAADFGMTWINQIKACMPPETWCIFVDADEYLIYKGWPHACISRYLASLTERDKSVFGFMLDMIPAGRLDEVDPSGDLLRTCPYFDRDYTFRWRPTKPWRKSNSCIEVIGGPRVRLFSNYHDEVRSGYLDYWIRGQLDRILYFIPKQYCRAIIERYPLQLPTLQKVPITRGHGKYHHAHTYSDVQYASHNCVLLHFKFTSELSRRIDVEIERGEHFRSGAEYVLYRKHLYEGARLLSLYDPALCARFHDSQTLEEYNLIRSMADFVGSSRPF